MRLFSEKKRKLRQSRRGGEPDFSDSNAEVWHVKKFVSGCEQPGLKQNAARFHIIQGNAPL